MGPMEADKEHVRHEPLTLPDKFVWDDVDLSDDTQVRVSSCLLLTCTPSHAHHMHVT